ncbi:uncharacterized protein TNCV_2484051 [Trichonephila clavipes]|uniref:Uncharacterized protein n=1 Tax=Trichonephila clavipes TaxID=2585209 RepID=A0A8X6VZF2_TRICX|nr:uncharacterized protein TNCV_2484051 [Trichonephila clavipes]
MATTDTSLSYNRAFGYGPRKSDPWSSDEDDTLAVTPSRNFHNRWTSDIAVSTGDRSRNLESQLSDEKYIRIDTSLCEFLREDFKSLLIEYTLTFTRRAFNGIGTQSLDRSNSEGEKDFNDGHREEITDFVQSIPGFQECDGEAWMACYAEDSGFQMLKDARLRLPCKKNPTLSTMKRSKTRATTTTKVARIHQILTRFLRWRQLWSGTNNNQSAVLLNNCCPRESEILQRKYEGVQCVLFHMLHGSHSVIRTVSGPNGFG